MAGDPSNPQSLNRYAYATNDPIDLLDPEGEYVCVTGCGGNLAMGIGGWDDFGDLSFLELAATPTVTFVDFNPAYINSLLFHGEAPPNTPITVTRTVFGHSSLLNLLFGAGGGGPGIPGGQGGSSSGGTGSTPAKLFLKATSDCFAGLERDIDYQLVSEGANGELSVVKGYTVTEHVQARTAQIPLDLTSSNTSQPPNQNTQLSGYKDSLGDQLFHTQDNLQNFTVAPATGGPSLPVFVRDINGNDFGTNGIFVSPTGQIFVNGTLPKGPC
jgi:hypothetical protein